MDKLDIKEIRKISINFRRIASRLIKTDFREGIENLKRFIDFIESNEVINDFIKENISDTISDFKCERGIYLIPVDKKGEISYTYQLLKAGTNECKEYYNLTGYAYGSGSKLQDHSDGFNERVVLPFINHITNYLDEILIDLEEEKVMIKNEMNFHGNAQVNQANDNGKIEAVQNNKNENANIEELIRILFEEIKKLEINDKEEVLEIIEAGKEETTKEKPKKSIIKLAIEKMTDVKNLGTASILLGKTAQELIDFFSKNM